MRAVAFDLNSKVFRGRSGSVVIYTLGGKKYMFQCVRSPVLIRARLGA